VPGDYLTFLRQRWEKSVFPAGSPVSFDAFWNASLHDGVARRVAPARPSPVIDPKPVLVAAAKAFQAAPVSGFELVLHADAKVFDGRYANNGWLQELPDPVTKVTWNNPVLVSIADAKRLGVTNGDDLKLEVGGRSVVAPVMVQPGQTEGVLSLSLGFGRSAGSVAHAVGVSAWPLFGLNADSPFIATGVSARPTGTKRLVARTQEHHSLGGRDIARLWTRADYAKEAQHPESPEKKAKEEATLYEGHPYPNQKWGMAIDLSGCVGCSGCVIACQSENNVPVVGPEQVAKGREMAWLRIDRYYEGPPEAPRVVHEPMLCQHCDNAPCENVCPVGATNHSPDGLNQMAYNRCVGTRYCANNCPYKVRRFNFFEFSQGGVFDKGQSEVRELAFNPEVTVRPRGVMEKCSFCVQRISNARQVAKADGRPIRDGEVKPACAAACPAEAISFGDLNDPGSRVAKLAASDRGFHVLAELGVRPAITYLADVRNPASEDA
jgi:molybdopterin-containing oxidoreductase family iron-sulfur binding subunit